MKYGYTPKWGHPKKMITHFSEVFKDVDVKKNKLAKSIVGSLGSRCRENVSHQRHRRTFTYPREKREVETKTIAPLS